MTIDHDLSESALRRDTNNEGESTWKIKISTIVMIILGFLTMVQGVSLWWVSTVSTAVLNHETRISKSEVQIVEGDKRLDGIICDLKENMKIFGDRQLQVLIKLGIKPHGRANDQ